MKILIQFLLSLIGSVFFGIVGLFMGATIGGNFGFPSFGGNSGYESGGVFFAILGISLGSVLVFYVIKKRRNEQFKTTSVVVAAVVTAVAGIIMFDYNMPGIVGLMILLMPSVVLTLITNRQWVLKEGIKKQLLFVLILFLVLILCVLFINQKKQKILGLNYKPVEEFCSSLSTNLNKDECSQNFDKCMVCGQVAVPSYQKCHSREFCENLPME